MEINLKNKRKFIVYGVVALAVLVLIICLAVYGAQPVSDGSNDSNESLSADAMAGIINTTGGTGATSGSSSSGGGSSGGSGGGGEDGDEAADDAPGDTPGDESDADEAEACTNKETDGGRNYTLKGTCYDGEHPEGLTDICGVEEYLTEYWTTDYPDCECTGALTQFHCPSLGPTWLCYNGACLNCAYDSDGGYNLYQAGTCESGYFGTTGDDLCIDGQLYEYYYSSCDCPVRPFDCGDGNVCKNGRCTSEHPMCSKECGSKNGFCTDYSFFDGMNRAETCKDEQTGATHMSAGDGYCPGLDICCCI